MNRIKDEHSLNIDNAGMVSDVKNWFPKIKPFSYKIEDMDDGYHVALTYNHDVSFDFSKKNKAKNHIVGLIKDKPNIQFTRRELLKALDMSEDTVKRAIKELQQEQIIDAHGYTKNRYFTATEQFIDNFAPNDEEDPQGIDFDLGEEELY